MFFKILLLLACYNLYKSVKIFLKESIVVKDGQVAAIPRGECISLGLTVVFYLMVISVCLLPSMLF